MENYKEKYERALETIQEILSSGSDSIMMSRLKLRLQSVFPELKVSEDEKIRKALIRFHKSTIDVDGIKGADILTWLEKQGKSIRIKKGKNYLCTKTHKYAGLEWIEGVKYYSPEDYALVNQGCTCHCPEYSKEKHNNFFKEVEYDGCVEVDNVKPKFIKFNVGDWIACEELNTAKIISFDSDRYEVEFIDGSKGLPHIDYVDSHFNLWTIADAKDGDVIFDKSDGTIGIFQSIGHHPDGGSYNDHSYCFLHCRYDDGYFFADFEDGNIADSDDVIPATKEQRDLLFQKMKEARYTFDFEKKELKKIEDEIEIPFGAKDSELQEETYFIPKGFHAEIDDDKVVIKKGEKSAAWSDEDEKMYKIAFSCIETLEDISNGKNMHADVKEWLKSLKNRIGG